MELFAEIVYGGNLLTISAKTSILDVWHGSEYASTNDADAPFPALHFQKNNSGNLAFK